MQCSRRQLQGGAIGLSGVVALILCAGLVFAASASAKAVYFTSPLAAPPGGNSWIDFKLKLKKKPGTNKFRPVEIRKPTLYFFYVDCPSGEPTRVPSFKYPDPIPVSNRKFSISDTRGGTTFEMKGRIPRNGPPTGTVRLVFDSGDPLSPGTCDSGAKSWSAKVVPPY
jgi:hypothetical protein